MPIYSIRCEDCHEQFEVRISMQEKEAGQLPECPKCHSKATQQTITNPSVIRRGAFTDVSSGDCGPGCC